MRGLVGLRETCDQCDQGVLYVRPLRGWSCLMGERPKKISQLQVISVVFLTDSMLQGCYAVHGRAHGFSARQVCCAGIFVARSLSTEAGTLGEHESNQAELVPVSSSTRYVPAAGKQCGM